MSPKRKTPNVTPVAAAAPEEIGEDTWTPEGELTPKQRRFVEEFCVDWNLTQAAARAGYSPETASAIGWENLKKPSVKKAIEKRMRDLSTMAEATGVRVISEIATIAFADPRELSRVEIDSCRHCWGEGHKYQWTTGEHERAVHEAMVAQKAIPEAPGGFGYTPHKEPHPACPECFGRGIPAVIVTDSRKLGPQAVRLMAAVKMDAKGLIEIKSHDQMAALVTLAKFNGLFQDGGGINIAINNGKIDDEAALLERVMQKSPKEMTDAELQLVIRAGEREKQRAKTIEGR